MRWEKTGRLLSLARELAGTSEGLTLDAMADCAGVTRRTAERMRDALRDLFPGFEEHSDGRTKRFKIVGGLSAFMTAPTADELAELEIVARYLAGTGHEARADLLRSLGGKVRASLRNRSLSAVETDLDALLLAEAVAVEAGPRRLIAPATLPVLREAIKATATVRFFYQARPRHVDPWGLLLGRVPYLVGPAVGHSNPFLWRVDRIAEIAIAKEVSSRPTEFSLEAYAARSFGTFQEEAHDITLRIVPEAVEEARGFLFHPHQMVTEEADGSLTVRFRAGGLLELVHHLFTWSDGVEILAPVQLRSLMSRELNRVLELYNAIQ